MQGIILHLSAIQLACVSSPVAKVENDIEKQILFWRDVSYLPNCWNTNFFVLYYTRTNGTHVQLPQVVNDAAEIWLGLAFCNGLESLITWVTDIT